MTRKFWVAISIAVIGAWIAGYLFSAWLGKQ